MDLTERKDNVAGAVVLGATTAVNMAQGVSSALKNFTGSIRHKAQLKQGLALVQAGKGDKMSGGMVDRLIEAGVEPSWYNTTPTYLSRPGNAAKAAAATKVLSNPNATITEENVSDVVVADKFKRYLPYIIGGVVLVVLVIFILKRK